MEKGGSNEELSNLYAKFLVIWETANTKLPLIEKYSFLSYTKEKLADSNGMKFFFSKFQISY